MRFSRILTLVSAAPMARLVAAAPTPVDSTSGSDLTTWSTVTINGVTYDARCNNNNLNMNNVQACYNFIYEATATQGACGIENDNIAKYDGKFCQAGDVYVSGTAYGGNGHTFEDCETVAARVSAIVDLCGNKGGSMSVGLDKATTDGQSELIVHLGDGWASTYGKRAVDDSSVTMVSTINVEESTVTSRDLTDKSSTSKANSDFSKRSDLQTTTVDGVEYQWVCNGYTNLARQDMLNSYDDLFYNQNECRVDFSAFGKYNGHFSHYGNSYITGTPYGGYSGYASCSCYSVALTLAFISNTCGTGGGSAAASNCDPAPAEQMVVHISDSWVDVSGFKSRRSVDESTASIHNQVDERSTANVNTDFLKRSDLQTATVDGAQYQYVCNMGNNLSHDDIISSFYDLHNKGQKRQICKVFDGDLKDWSGHFANFGNVYITGVPFPSGPNALASAGCGDVSNAIYWLSQTCGDHGGSVAAANSEGGSELVVHVNDHWV